MCDVKKIRIENESDSLYLKDDEIHAVEKGVGHIYSLASVKRMIVLTTDMGPMYDDMCLAVEMDCNEVVFIMSEHADYSPFLFEQIGKVLEIDYQKVIEAATCIENSVFEIYNR
ncbi:hypothetical protein [Treponema sp.]|uniref:hypothetical protein n=1 Tax=Treponema sp. TaxID=166 RepID=UPI00298DBDF5|nr:hypothetical protein [Treponema sp.]MCQ2241621.1 hypothetical protein [Treponema sp.]